MKLSEHLSELHKASLGHHTSMIAAHETALKKAKDMMEDGDVQTAFHKSEMASHQQMADFHEGALEECRKAIAASDLAKANSLVPDRISAFPREFSTTVTPVMRAGQPQIEKSAVAPEFEHLVAIEGE